MSAGLPTVIRPSDCCTTSCTDSAGSQIPGPQGPPGTNGTNGTNGSNAYTTTTAQFVMPASLANVTVDVADSSWVSVGQALFVQTAGYFAVNAVPDATHLSLTNFGYNSNVPPATLIATAQKVSPAGVRGLAGIPGPVSGAMYQGSGAPVAAPSNPVVPALYCDLDTGVLYTWNVITQLWI